jgi:hypothetical protein
MQHCSYSHKQHQCNICLDMQRLPPPKLTVQVHITATALQSIKQHNSSPHMASKFSSESTSPRKMMRKPAIAALSGLQRMARNKQTAGLVNCTITQCNYWKHLPLATAGVLSQQPTVGHATQQCTTA